MARIAEWFINHRVLNNGANTNGTKQRRLAAGTLTFILIASLALATTFYLAKILSSPKEILSKRTPISQTYRINDKQLATKIYPQAKWYKDSEGNWQEVDTTLKVQGNNITTSNLPYKVSFSKDVTKPLDFRILGLGSGVSAEKEAVIAFSPTSSEPRTPSPKNVKVKITSNKATYFGIYPNVNLERVITPQGLKQNYVLTAKGHPTSFSEKIQTN